MWWELECHRENATPIPITLILIPMHTSSFDQRSYSTPGPVSTGMGDRLRASKPPRFVTSHSGQLSLLPSAGRKMSTGQSAVMLCGCMGAKAGMVNCTCG